jgi:hypothetical protein
MDMRGWAIVVLVILLSASAVPVLAGNEDKYGYITIENVDITLDKGKANIDVRYSLDEPTQVIVFLLGKQDLKSRIVRVLNYEDAQVTRIDMNRAQLVVEDVSYNYGRGIYWFPSHQFNVIIPSLRVTTPQASREYVSTRELPNGLGYFDSPM